MKSLKTITLNNLQKVKSSNIAQVGFDEGVTYVQFTNGNIYKYPETKLEDFEGLVKAESVGKQFGKTYRNLQKYEKLKDVVLKLNEEENKD